MQWGFKICLSILLTLKGGEKERGGKEKEITICLSNENIKPRDSNELFPPQHHHSV